MIETQISKNEREKQEELNERRFNVDIPFSLIERLTITEIKHALQHMANRYYDKHSKNEGKMYENKTWKTLNTAIKHLTAVEEELLKEFPAKDSDIK